MMSEAKCRTPDPMAKAMICTCQNPLPTAYTRANEPQ